MALNVMDHVEYTGNVMLPTQNGTGFMMMQNGGVVPPSLLQESRIPRFYKEAIAKCGATNPSQLPSTALVYNLMVTSRLPRAVLGNIWSLVNRTLPGQLTRQEFFSCLALIALIQKGQPLSALSTMSSLPIPHLQACAPFAQYLPGAGNLQQQGFPQNVQNKALSSLPQAAQAGAAAAASASTSSAMSLLADINFSTPLGSSTNFTHLTAASAAQIPASQSQPSIGSTGTLQTGNLATTLQFPAATGIATSQPLPVTGTQKQWFNFTAHPKDRALLNDIQQTSSSTSSQNSDLFGDVPNTSGDMLKTVPQVSHSRTVAGTDNSTSTNVGTGASVVEPIKGPDVYAAMKLISDANKDKEEENIRVWQRCIEEACKLFRDADSLLPPAAAAYIAEIAHTDRGARYLKALHELHDMTIRIRRGRTDKLIKQKEALQTIDKIWTRLEGFVEKKDDNDNDCIINQSGTTICGTMNLASTLCGICLSHISADSLLEFTGTAYHKQCANLWINRVDSLLPKLKNF